MDSCKVVVVTGAGTGIGRATARMFAGMGAQVVAIGRRAEPLAEAAAGHDGIHPLTADVAAEGAAGEIMRAVMESHGRLDVLVNNAGIVGGGTLGTIPGSWSNRSWRPTWSRRSCWPKPRCPRWRPAAGRS